MEPVIQRVKNTALLLTAASALLAANNAGAADDWWNKEWTARKKITIDTTPSGAALTEAPAGALVLVRLHEGNFSFSANSVAEHLRFVAADGKTELPFYTESYDLSNYVAHVWVKVPDLKGAAKTDIWMYHTHNGGPPAGASDAKAIIDPGTAAVYHFAENGALEDSTGAANGSAGTPESMTLIGNGVSYNGTNGSTITAVPAIAWTAGGAMTWSAWVKPAGLNEGIIFNRGSGAEAFTIGVGAGGVPYVEVGGQRAPSQVPLADGGWKHLAVTASGGQVLLFVDGVQTGTLAAGLPANNADVSIGKPSGSPEAGFNGAIDEMEIGKVARPAAWIKFSAMVQHAEDGAKVVTYGADEAGGGGWLSGNSTSAVLIRSLTVDGWIVIAILAVMSVISWWIMYSKMRYLGGITKGNNIFMNQWKHVMRDLTALDRRDNESIRSMGGRVDKEGERSMRKSSVYRIYHIGSDEIRHRLEADDNGPGQRGLSARSIEAIKASMDGGLVRETQRLNKLIVLLTICISGGPFLGLLGTVIGVMITFASIAAAGDVNVNSIAPGIAGALLATVAGLAVAIPALFGYNYIVSRVKEATSDMHVFIDEFVTRMAEFYPEKEA